MRPRASILLVVACAFAATSRAQPSPPGRLTLALGESSVVISGVTPKANVAWFGDSRDIESGAMTLVREQGMATDDDGDGTITITRDKPISPQSIWIAVDVNSGAIATSAAPGATLRPLPVAASPLQSNLVPGIDVFAGDFKQVSLLLVRPGVGAWAVHAGDGGPADHDQSGDGRIQVGLDSVEPLGSTPALDAPRARPGDVLVVVDPLTLNFYAARLTGR